MRSLRVGATAGLVVLACVACLGLQGPARAYDALSPTLFYGHGDAQDSCPTACAALGGWNGNWTSDYYDFSGAQISVCGCKQRPNVAGCETDAAGERKEKIGGCVMPVCESCNIDDAP